MSQLFAALDARGEIRFVGDVQRGAACACFCPDCSSPLIARQGTEKEWHFAHEGGQERPECLVGAQNLLRRFCMEHLQYLALSGPLTLPPCRIFAQLTTAYFRGHEPIEVAEQFMGSVRWEERPVRDAAAGTARLTSGVEVVVLIHTHEGTPSHPVSAGQEVASVAYFLPPPDPAARRDAASLVAHIEGHGKFLWLHHPLLKQLHAQAMARLQQRSDEAMKEANARLNHKAGITAAQRWGKSAQMLRERMHGGGQEGNEPPAPPPPPPSYPMAPGHAPLASFQFFELKSGDAWVVYPMDPEFVKRACTPELIAACGPGAKMYGVAPYPEPYEGWDEMLPPSVGRSDLENGLYWVPQPLNAAMFLSPRSARTDSNRDWNSFLANDPP